MFPLLLGVLAFGAGTTFLTRVHHDIDIDGDRMVAQAIQMLGLKEKLDAADGALRDVLVEVRADSAALTAQGVDSLKSVTEDVHNTLDCVRILLLIVGLWYVLRMLVWAVWFWRGDKEKKQEPVMLVVLGSGAETRALGVGESGVIQLHSDTVSRQRARSSL
ncbi:hypothetical protein DAEQUDRAFT_390878 [Daedalea quercina L-15889]|uniref:Uncharacterized protein n=1 Tax=Daedalea quercina L-15889 TaxID=1314783 RepID=A0A165NV77_9APHY|nr:hypothetical protein DAEQUDRAFT_390878 [Daedalea quercina L-15889]